jgi:DNA oxidative demethylase
MKSAAIAESAAAAMITAATAMRGNAGASSNGVAAAMISSAPTSELSEEASDDKDCHQAIIGGWITVLRKQLKVTYAQVVQPGSPASAGFFHRLEEQIHYLTGKLSQVKIYGKWHPLPRKQAGYGEPGVYYSFTGHRLKATDWATAPVLGELLALVQSAANTTFNFVFINRYADGGDRIGEHRDADKDLDPVAPIASLTFGASRDFYFKHTSHRAGDKSEPLVKIQLDDGMLMLMHPPTNSFWHHALPTRKGCKEARINLTFRRIRTTDRANGDRLLSALPARKSVGN